jgi:undecaprenyl-diphosphatase
MSVPIIAGAVAFQLGSLFADGIPEGLLVPMIVGIVTAGISGWFAMWGMIRLLRTRAFTGFVVYRVIVGVAVLGLLATSFR